MRGRISSNSSLRVFRIELTVLPSIMDDFVVSLDYVRHVSVNVVLHRNLKLRVYIVLVFGIVVKKGQKVCFPLILAPLSVWADFGSVIDIQSNSPILPLLVGWT